MEAYQTSQCVEVRGIATEPDHCQCAWLVPCSRVSSHASLHKTGHLINLHQLPLWFSGNVMNRKNILWSSV